jgi:hypothetical protein
MRGRVFGGFEEPSHDWRGCNNVKVDFFDNNGMCSHELNTVGKRWGNRVELLQDLQIRLIVRV